MAASTSGALGVSSDTHFLPFFRGSLKSFVHRRLKSLSGREREKERERERKREREKERERERERETYIRFVVSQSDFGEKRSLI